MVEPIEPKRLSRASVIAVTSGVVVAGALVAYGVSRSDDDGADTPPTIAVIQAPAEVFTTQAVVPPPSPQTTDDVQVVPPGTVDIAFPPISTDILVP